VLVSDGVFSKSKLREEFDFVSLPRPSQAELFELVEKIKRRILKKAEEKENFDQSQFDENELGTLAKSSLEQRALFGERAGFTLRRFGAKNISHDPEDCDPTTANIDGSRFACSLLSTMGSIVSF